ncbi:hypothetical protein Micbo1qcDRAFT_197362 [Microdochium bolleyi]|uniref:Uncharacterized protein n=1 Tax=Microdochium bolleyi TaxID=196109 RepID=A0A136IUL7_9PEZI|nr:hypothetical protein Micbo1qcDRAFT_197362 [Microdochium bolleyi]
MAENNPSTRARTNSDTYTIGWICALPTEYVAARAFLDEQHDEPDSVAVHDGNNYTLGRMGRHQVAIAVLPDGEYGTTSAAMVARDMLHSFRNIRIGLMVGIGGGAPSGKHDVRLGDVVVSRPQDGYGGVFQYDFGKTIQEKAFQETQFLNAPPTVLRAAVSGLKAQHEMEGHGIEEMISSVLKKYKRLQKKYARPGHDRLFRSSFLHMSEDDDCTGCASDLVRLSQRGERDSEDEQVVIHYGLIASSNQLMKDALIRDRLAADKGVVCFEMEAAGLMNHFPCLVIRGICDYADTHKNKDWQGYAAMAAAAYAKQILYQIAPNKIEAQQKAMDVVNEIRDTTHEIAADVRGIVARLGDEKLDTILDWFSPVDFGQKHHDQFHRHHPGTGRWFLQSETYKAWNVKKGSILFGLGMPGAGKTVLTSILIDDLLRNKQAADLGMGYSVAWIYCDFRDSDDQKLDNLLGSLLKQLLQQHGEIPKGILARYESSCEMKTRFLTADYMSSLQDAIRLNPRTYFFIDALDECTTAGGVRDQLLDHLHILQQDVLRTEIRAAEEDIRHYAESHMYRFPPFVIQEPQLQSMVISTVVDAVEGMFLLAKLHLDALPDNHNTKLLTSALQAIRKAVDAYGYAYDIAMERICSQPEKLKDLAIETLSWLVLPGRQLEMRQLQCALAIELNSVACDQSNVTDAATIISVCAGLVTVDSTTGVVGLVHYTTKEYFETARQRWFPRAMSTLPKKLLTYLTYSEFKTGRTRSQAAMKTRLKDYPLYKFACDNWGWYSRSYYEEDTREAMLGFLCDTKCVESAIQILEFDFRTHRWTTASSFSCETPWNVTHLVAVSGSSAALELLAASHEVSLDGQDRDGRTPLMLAIMQWNKSTASWLIEHEASVDLADNLARSPLTVAVISGNAEIVQMLVAARAPLDQVSTLGETPICRAAMDGHSEIVRELVAAGASLDIPLENGRTPLSWAASSEDVTMLQILLDGGASPDTQSHDGASPLRLAAEAGRVEAVEILINFELCFPERSSENLNHAFPEIIAYAKKERAHATHGKTWKLEQVLGQMMYKAGDKCDCGEKTFWYEKEQWWDCEYSRKVLSI